MRTNLTRRSWGACYPPVYGNKWNRQNRGLAVKNPAWSEPELILALHAYFQQKESRFSRNEVRDLSELLNRLCRYQGFRSNPTLRNESGLMMKLGNFSRFDPDVKGRGLAHGAALDERIWNQYAGDQKELKSMAAGILALVKELDRESAKQGFVGDVELVGNIEGVEGALVERVHRVRERNRVLVAKAKASMKKKHGKLYCEACRLDPTELYGPSGADIIEAHHERPLAVRTKASITKLSDLKLLCPNCHRAVHAARPWLTVAGLRAKLRPARTN